MRGPIGKAAELSPVLLIALLVGCGGADSTSPHGLQTTPLPPLEAVPYDRLGHGTLAFQREAISAPGYTGVYVVNAESRTSTPTFGGRLITAPAISPDGRLLAYTEYVDTTTAFDVFVSNPDDSGTRHASSFLGQEGPPSWTPDGRQILFSVEEHLPGVTNVVVYRQSPVENPVDRVRAAVFTLANGLDFGCPWLSQGGDGPISVSAQGRLAFTCFTRALYVMDPDGRNVTALAMAPAAAGGLRYRVFAPAWSPDGLRVAYLDAAADSLSSVFRSVSVRVVDAVSGALTTLATVPAAGFGNLAADNGTNLSLCWSPVGGWLAFSMPDGDVRSHIYVVGADGSALTRFTSAPDAYDRSVSCAR